MVAALIALGRRGDARELVSFVPDCVVLFKRLVRDRRVPFRAKLALLCVIPYLLLPFDLIPDFIPVAGQLDDAILVAIVVAYVTRAAGRNVVAELWPGSDTGLRALLVLTRTK
jgi:uncharacterized membrane protein YkvA (DUF1232 family)